MSGAGELTPPAPAKQDPETLVLRGRPRPAVRFRRGLIVGTAGALALAVSGLVWLALSPPSFRQLAEPEARETSAHRPETIAHAPQDYGDVPRLGPPLPGDLGRPILEHQRSLAADDGVEVGAPVAAQDPARMAAEAERQRRAAEAQAALKSALEVPLTGKPAGAARDIGDPGPAAAEHAAGSPSAAPDPAGQGRKIAFASSSAGDQVAGRLAPAPSPWTVSAGTLIPASLITGLNSDLPGLVLAQVTEPVRDSATGRTVLIPQGARLIGRYDSIVAFGQRRALLVWQRLVFPDGASVRLESMPATDLAGFAGVEDRVDFHTWRLIQGVMLSSLLGAGAELGRARSGDGSLLDALRDGVQESGSRAGDQLTQRNLDVQPTLRVRPGWPLRAMVHKDLVLRPWKG